eukprot:CAMPEP_0197288812 /NCGR_PEP_ID=MMETSP0890-20130614/5983_1 /TAXON_ID=44058 ORGANISM="Aureoumbra lagunensis, Strain CCMP1510" /NCGR_SAMPLE_ID=MMETSP0890 /ASSEMBLY_ACC=CAM_ASM_000533 /LENGTH=284 /DNA_ID=CAMNT_0042759799 /DNA_START=746 /DNA_END=1600 /DNA_ORIENTATION=-
MFSRSKSSTPITSAIRKVSKDKLYVSEPPPEWFGNSANPRNDPTWTNGNWLKSRFHFSFAEYGDGPQQFGVLRVQNDDLVQPKRMFGTHPHSNMEIITYVVEGDLTHKDSRGNEETLGPGSIQFMSAGTGIRHSEGNPNEKPLRFIQSWITPRRMNLTPNYGSARGEVCSRRDQWTRVAADWEDKTADDEKIAVRIHQDCNVWATETTKELDFELAQGRQAYLLCVDGAVDISSQDEAKSLERHDAAELYGPLKLHFTPKTDNAHMLMFEMASSPGRSGRPDAE